MWWREFKENKKKVVDVPKAAGMNHRTHYFLKKEWVGPGPTKICIKHDLQLSCCASGKFIFWRVKTNKNSSGGISEHNNQRHALTQQPLIPFLSKIGWSIVQGSPIMRTIRNHNLIWVTKRTLTTFHHTSCLIGILLIAYYSIIPISLGSILLYINNQGPFFRCSRCRCLSSQWTKQW